MSTLVHPRYPARRGAVRAVSWWARAWVRAAEEATYDEADATQARRLARSGRIGALGVEPGRATAVVEDTAGVHQASVAVPTLEADAWETFVDELAARAGHAAALLAGELPHELMEEVEAGGVELLPYGSELTGDCPCDSWVQPCRHALALAYQLGWWVEEDPFVLLHLRGRSREEVLAGLDARYARSGEPGELGSSDEPGASGESGASVELMETLDPMDPGVRAAVEEAAGRARLVLGLADHAPAGHGLADSAVAAYDVAIAALLAPVEDSATGPVSRR